MPPPFVPPPRLPGCAQAWLARRLCFCEKVTDAFCFRAYFMLQMLPYVEAALKVPPPPPVGCPCFAHVFVREGPALGMDGGGHVLVPAGGQVGERVWLALPRDSDLMSEVKLHKKQTNACNVTALLMHSMNRSALSCMVCDATSDMFQEANRWNTRRLKRERDASFPDEDGPSMYATQLCVALFKKGHNTVLLSGGW